MSSIQIQVPIRVHAIASAIPICPLPQGLDFLVDGIDGTISIFRVSGEDRFLLDSGGVLEIWRQWLPVTWGKNAIRGRSIPKLDAMQPKAEDVDGQVLLAIEALSAKVDDTDGRNWSVHPLVNREALSLTTPGTAPPIELSPTEIEMALLLVGTPTAEQRALKTDFPQHPIGEKFEEVVRHNHRIHEIAQEVEEIEL